MAAQRIFQQEAVHGYKRRTSIGEDVPVRIDNSLKGSVGKAADMLVGCADI